jgi:hypothetical protein
VDMPDGNTVPLICRSCISDEAEPMRGITHAGRASNDASGPAELFRNRSVFSPMPRLSPASYGAAMLPLSDGISARRFPIVNVSIIVANFAVWLFYELPHLQSSVFHGSFYPCTVDGSCRGPESWGISWITAMFLHGSWDHILGNMLFLAVWASRGLSSRGRIDSWGCTHSQPRVAAAERTRERCV